MHTHLFGEGFGQAHNASADVEATARCFLELIRLGLYTPAELRATPQYIEDFRRANPEPIKAIGLNVQPYTLILRVVYQTFFNTHIQFPD